MERLFGCVDNLNMFIHPKFNESFKFMDDKQSIELARKILNKFKESGYENVVVIESGTSPLIAIIKKLKEYKDCSFKITQIKIPRDLDFNLLEWFNIYLSEEELKELVLYNEKSISRYEALKEISNKFSLEDFIGNDKFTIYDSVNNLKEYNNSTEDFIKVLNGTKMYELFNKPFLLFDEYINAGTIIRNFNGIVRLFNMNPKFKLSAFCMFLDNPKEYEKIAFTLYDNSNELECYRNGAYPFENRIDLIGYYYYISKKDFMKVSLEELKQELEEYDNNSEVNLFYNKLNELMEENKFISNADNLISAAMEREKVLSTAMDGDVAFPHVRGVEGGALTLAMGVSKEGIDWDGEKVHFVFLSAIPVAVSAFYLKLIAGIAQRFTKKDVRSAALAAKDSKSLWKALSKATKQTVK